MKIKKILGKKQRVMMKSPMNQTGILSLKRVKKKIMKTIAYLKKKKKKKKNQIKKKNGMKTKMKMKIMKN